MGERIAGPRSLQGSGRGAMAGVGRGAVQPAWQPPPLLRLLVLSDDQQIWLASFVSLTAYFLSTQFGTLAMVLCLGVWGVYTLAWPSRVWGWLRSGGIIYALPAVAIASTLWSIEKQQSLKLGMESLLFTSVGVMMARSQSARSFVSALLCTVSLCVAASMVFGGKTAVGNDGVVAIIGLFGSKNNFAFVICLMMLASCGVITDRGQHRAFRIIATFGLLSAPALLIKTVSLGALLSGGIACMAVGAVLLLSWVPPRWRKLFLTLAVVFLIGACVVIGIAVSQGIDLSTLLESVGKDASLTGRTFLWDRARSFIRENPVFGLGYQAFWVQGHVEAEGLWRYAQIESRMGFHFHNLFFATAVELGYFGVIVYAIQIATCVAAVFIWGLRRPSPVSAFFVGLFLFYVSRLGVELDFLAPFASGLLLMSVGWTLARRALKGRGDSQAG